MKKTDYSKVFVTSNHHFGSHLLVPQLQIYTKKQEDELIDKWIEFTNIKNIKKA